ncbi:MAG: UDP-N-acetylmuramoyl-L-alanyl-D-glutamate--2,6-diaminopimelate ligase [Kiritimatiellia bacterium]
MKLEMLLAALPEAQCRGSASREIAGLACDSRQVRPGWLFIAIPGNKLNGANFIEDALTRGAAAVVAEQAGPPLKDVTVIRVANAREALARLASAFYGRPSARLRVAGVTGTNGKTTVTYLVRDILEAAGYPCGLIGTVEYRLGNRVIPAARTTPDPLTLQSCFSQMLQNGCTAAVMEVSSHALDQERAWGIEFDAAVFTNLTQDHLDYHGTMESYFEAKKKLFLAIGRGSKTASAIVNLDDPYGRRLASDPGIAARMLTYGRSPDALIRAEEVRLSASGSAFRVVSPWGGGEAALRLLGGYNVSNALAALAVCGCLGLPLPVILKRLAELHAVPGRLEEVPNTRGFQVFVDYAHTDDALMNVLQTLREICAGRLIAVFGCGGNRDKTKRAKMGAAAARLADFTVLTSDNPRTEDPMAILEQIRGGMGGAPHEVAPDRAEAIKRALAIAGKGDIVLIAGKGHETFQEFDNRVIPFDDRDVARNLLK